MANKEFKQLCFNELTLYPSPSNETEMYNRVMIYAKTLKETRKSLGTKLVRYENDLSHIMLSEEVSLHEFCSEHRREVEFVAILSSHTMPQVDPDDTSSKGAYESSFASVIINGEQRSSKGLAAAYVYNVPSIGFDSEKCWDNVMHSICVLYDGKRTLKDWPCLTNPEHLMQDDFIRWVQEHSEVELIKTTLTFEQKPIKFRDDHGKDVLQEHASILCHNEYVEGVLCSLPWKGNYREYIYDVKPDGLIDIVLFWDDRGLSMRVKTTGRNIQETTAIAKILQEKYSK